MYVVISIIFVPKSLCIEYNSINRCPHVSVTYSSCLEVVVSSYRGGWGCHEPIFYTTNSGIHVSLVAW